MQLLSLAIFNKHIEVVCHHTQVFELLRTNFNAFISNESFPTNDIDLSYEADFDDASQLYSLVIDPDTILTTPLVGKFLYWMEKEITISLQKICSHLYFLHAAALEYNDHAFILTGPTGSGKSTMAWALSKNNCGYLSDELAPVDPHTMEVQPFPHALCLKTEPASPYNFPDNVLMTERATHIPVTNKNITAILRPLRLKTIFVIKHGSTLTVPSCRKLHKAEAALYLYSNTLNALAHDNAGLNCATAIVSNCDCYELITADLSASCGLIKQCLDNLKSDI